MRHGSLGAFLAASLTLVLLAGSVHAQSADDPIIGVWQLNVERSVWNPGPRAPADARTTRTYSMLPGGWMQFVQVGYNLQGVPNFQIGVFKHDGQRHPVHSIATLGPFMTTNQASNLTRSYRVIDPRTTESTTYNNGVAANPLVRSVAPDGSFFVETNRGTNAQGVEISNTLVWDRIQ